MTKSVDFIFHERVRQIFRHFTRLLGIRIVFFSKDGFELEAGDDQPNCDYCRLLRQELGYEMICHKFDRQKQIEAAETKRLISYQCHGGMTEAVLPIFEDDKLLGFIMIGQYRLENNIPEKIKKKWKERFKNNLLERAFLKSPLYNQKKADDISGFFEILVEHIVTQHFITTKRYTAVQEVKRWIDEHPSETLSLTEAANLVHKSVSSFSHLFKESTGESFGHYQIKQKLNKADKYFEQNPEMNIGQVAYKLGYNDQFYFSKLYKKYKGISPSEFISKS